MFSICGVKKRFRVREVVKTVIDDKGVHEVTMYEVCKLGLFGWKVAQVPYMHFEDQKVSDDKFKHYLIVKHTILPCTCSYYTYAEAYEALIYLGYRHKYKGYTICKAVYVDGKNTLNSTTHEYWYVEEAKNIINDAEHGIFYEYELYDNMPDALNYVDKKTFKPCTKSKKWLG